MACFAIFEPTFGNSLQKFNFAKVSFLGPILQTIDLSLNDNYQKAMNKNISKELSFLKPSLVKKEKNIFLTLGLKPRKPLAAITSNKGKVTFTSEVDLGDINKPKKEPTIIFYPPLPYSFLLYFRDRQIAHIEFMFYISSNGKISSIKRKISSGSLDADLLSLRYIAHCLNLVEGKFPHDTWQTVKIDLTRKND